MKHKKRLAARILKTSPGKIRFSESALGEIQKAITGSDIRGLIAVGKITQSTDHLQSKARSRKKAAQKRKGRQKGHGRKKGSKNAEITKKEKWMGRIRVQRGFIKELKEKGLLSTQHYRQLYAQTKGGYFRNKRHIKLYLTEHGLIQKKQN